jgi:hypothetical protein
MRSLSFFARLGLGTLLVLAGMVPILHAQRFSIFDVPDSLETLPVSINLSGEVTGSYVSTKTDHFGNLHLGFGRKTDGTIAVFDAGDGEEGQQVFPTAINLGGHIAGYIVDLPCLDCARSFVREPDGTLTIFRVPIPFEAQSRQLQPTLALQNYIRGTSATDINAFGQIAGVFAEAPGSLGFVRQRDGTTSTFTAPRLVDPPLSVPSTVPQAINDLGLVTGYTNGWTFAFHGFLRKPNGSFVTFDPLDSTNTIPKAINLLGEITGFYSTADDVSHGFLRQTNGRIVTFDPPGSVSTQANAINLVGQIVGYYFDGGGIAHGFIREHNGRISTFDAPGTVFSTFAQDINLLGQITGYYTDASGTHGFVRWPRH